MKLATTFDATRLSDAVIRAGRMAAFWFFGAVFTGALVLTLLASPTLSAQGTLVVEETHEFGPPLRNNTLFSYVRTERVRVEMLDEDGLPTDTSERVLIYYITERQRPAPQGAGAMEIEANIDSMTLQFRGGVGDVAFDTQKRDHVSDVARVRHPAVLVPSALVNSVAHLTISPYGRLVSIRSHSIKSLREQAESPHLDDFTYKRLDHVLDDRFLTTVLFPWSNVVPLGRTIPYGEPVMIPLTTAIDRVVLSDSARIVVEPSLEDPRKPVLTFSSLLNGMPENIWTTFDNVTNPVMLSGVKGQMSGRFELDQDGVVLNGFTTAEGLMHGSAQGRPVSARIRHETFIELAGMTAFETTSDR